MAEGMTYDERITGDFLFELAKKGKVKLFSHQVRLEAEGSYLDIKDLKLPDGCYVEAFGANPEKDEWKPTAWILFYFKR